MFGIVHSELEGHKLTGRNFRSTKTRNYLLLVDYVLL